VNPLGYVRVADYFGASEAAPEEVRPLVEQLFRDIGPDIALGIEENMLVDETATVSYRFVPDRMPASRVHADLIEDWADVAPALVLRIYALPAGGVDWHRKARLRLT
jgi:hypothetical protein